jgi:ferric-dicitrate binding protein FerR (iron transport regulator)
LSFNSSTGRILALDRSSSVMLDKFVYSVSKRGDQVVIGLTKGAFRFATGGLPKAAYRIETPLASIGVRGTVLTIVSLRNETRVSLDEGGATVCSRRGARACLDLDPSSPSEVLMALPLLPNVYFSHACPTPTFRAAWVRNRLSHLGKPLRKAGTGRLTLSSVRHRSRQRSGSWRHGPQGIFIG